MNIRPLLDPFLHGSPAVAISSKLIDAAADIAIELAARRKRDVAPLVWAAAGALAGAALVLLVTPSRRLDVPARGLPHSGRARVDRPLDEAGREHVSERAPQTAHIVGEARDVYGPSEA